ncbi:MAG: hypothetical protein JSR62_05775 [Nitrospira sp.]|nr:hypothetical protein [Nitrospira sp.]
MDGNATFHASKRLAIIVFLLTICFGVADSGPGFAAGVWTNEPAGANVLLDCPFSGNVCQMFNVYGNQPFSSDSTGPVSPSGILDEVLEANATTGGGQFIYEFQASLGQTAREVYVGTFWKTNSQFQGMFGGSIANKMIFISGEGNNNFLNWYGPPDSPRQLLWAMQSVQNNCHVSGWSGGCGGGSASGVYGSGVFQANAGGSGVVSAGTGWHLIEIYQRASTTDTSRDGVIKWWVDNQLVGNYTNVNLAPGGFTNVQYNHTWDGSAALQCYPASSIGRDCSRAWHHMWDHLRVSGGGSGTSRDQPPGPPATPSLRSVTTP